MLPSDEDPSEIDPETPLPNQLDQLCKLITALGKERVAVTHTLKKTEPSIFETLPAPLLEIFPDKSLFKKINPTNLNQVSVGGVDGGIMVQPLTAIDIILIRTIGVTITYNQAGVWSTKYFPSKIPKPHLFLSRLPFEADDFDIYTSYRRALKELSTAVQLISSPSEWVDVLLMDGSFSLATRSSNPTVTNILNEIVKNIKILHEKAREKGSYIAWIVKDTRQSNFVDFIGRMIPKIARKVPEILNLDYRMIINHGRDQAFMTHLLPEAHRSFILKEPLASQYAHFDFPYDLYSFFLKVSPYDSPMRIDYLLSVDASSAEAIKVADLLSSYILPVSKIHSGYSLPVPIIEADLRVRIDRGEFDTLINTIERRVMSTDMKRRRERSPFKLQR